MSVARRELGIHGEDLAAAFVQRLGYEIVVRNWRLAGGELRGELDLVCRDGDTLVVIEVKTRRGSAHGGPLVAVTWSKQAKIRALTAAFLRQASVHAARIRFDVIGVEELRGQPPHVQHVEAAF